MSQARLTVICGPMFSGKTEELIRRVVRAQIAGYEVAVFKPVIDDRYAKDKITAHNGTALEATVVRDSAGILANLLNLGGDLPSVIAIDEAQFFDDEITEVVLLVIDLGVSVVVAGLNLDFRGEPFGQMPYLLSQADELVQVTAICTYRHEGGSICGEDATRTQRIIDGKPAHYDEPIVLVGASEAYEARCREHHIVPGKNGI